MWLYLVFVVKHEPNKSLIGNVLNEMNRARTFSLLMLLALLGLGRGKTFVQKKHYSVGNGGNSYSYSYAYSYSGTSRRGCVKNWHRCDVGKICCGGWLCTAWKHGKRCEPPASSYCEKEWTNCSPHGMLCCGGWICKPWKWGSRCEPPTFWLT